MRGARTSEGDNHLNCAKRIELYNYLKQEISILIPTFNDVCKDTVEVLQRQAE